MTYLQEFSRAAAKKYLQSIVFVDDEIYSRVPNHPLSNAPELPKFASPFAGNYEASSEAIPASTSDQKAPLHPRDLVESFASNGMVCALYEPRTNFSTDTNSELFKLCERSDAAILDWDLFNFNGTNILPLIKNLVSHSQSTVPHHSRLVVIYTATPDLSRVTNDILTNLTQVSPQIATAGAPAPNVLTVGATRIVVLGKPDVPGRPQVSKALEVSELHLANRVIDEFAEMHQGILPAFALDGLATVRQNSKRILDKFSSDLDGAFLLHRALIVASEEAFEQLPELIAEEVLAVMLDAHVPADTASRLVGELADSFDFRAVSMKTKAGVLPADAGDLPRKFLVGGEPAVRNECKFADNETSYIKQLHSAMGCVQSHADKRLAALFSLRTRYFKSKAPTLGLGTVVVREIGEGDTKTRDYLLCLMPLCDSVRLNGPSFVFPFWKLRTNINGAPGRGIVVVASDGQYVELFATGKPREMLSLYEFQPTSDEVVEGLQGHDGGPFIFTAGALKQDPDGGPFIFTAALKFEWIAQLKPAHAQRIAHDVGQAFSRIGVVEAEWIRRRTSQN